jgi:hypothetical protein
VLDDVRDVDLGTGQPGIRERPVEEPTGRTDEGLAGAVLPVARLLADQRHAGIGRPVAEDRLGGLDVQVAPAAGLDGGGQVGRRPGRRHEPLGPGCRSS